MRLGLAQHISRLVTQRTAQHGVEMLARFVVAAEIEAFIGERDTIRDGVGAGELIGKFAQPLVGIERLSERGLRLLALDAAHPFRDHFQADIGERAKHLGSP